MDIEFHVQNVKCDGCASAIEEGLSKDRRVNKVTVGISTGRVTVTSDQDIRADLSVALEKLGYPEKAA